MKLWAFIKRGFLIQLSYKLSFMLNILGIFTTIGLFYFMSKAIGSGAKLGNYSGDYLSFLTIGAVYQGFVMVALNSFNDSIHEEQQIGTLEVLFMSETHLLKVLLYSSAWSYVEALFATIVTASIAIGLFGMQLHINFLSVLVIFILTALAFAGLSMISAAFTMVVKKGDPVTWFFGLVAGIMGGAYFPVEVMPSGLRFISSLLPNTYALAALRSAVTTAASIKDLSSLLIPLTVFAILTPIIGAMFFLRGFDLARKRGSISQY